MSVYNACVHSITHIFTVCLTVYYKNFIHTITQNYSYLDENMYKKQHRKKANVQKCKYLM